MKAMGNPTYPLSKPRSSFVLEGLVLKQATTLGCTTSYQEYTLREVSLDELIKLRLSRKPGLVLKKEGKFFYTEFCENLHFSSQNLGPHLCGICSNVCKHCTKVDDWTLQYHLRKGSKFKTAMLRSGRIEKYDFIPYALETFNCNLDTYLVLECSNHHQR